MPSFHNRPNAYNEAFLTELSRLNPAQRQAVEQIEGPVLVIAGPGTGKTHILTARIGYILMETDTQPSNILCLTFTEAGVHAMRQRLLEFIGPEAHRVHIYTFHSFCNKVIQENMELFGRHDLEPLSELERVELIRKIIDGLPPTHPLRHKSHNIYFYENHLDDLFSRMKTENWQVDYMQQQIDEYMESLPHRESYIYKKKTKDAKPGDVKQHLIDMAAEKMSRLRAAVALFPAYIKLMKQASRYDFDDMILWVLHAFQNNKPLLRSYQEQYLYFLIDEYQDTNGAQNQIIKELIDYWENPNIFIVGDDDQSIFEFQGARLKNLIDFYKDYRSELILVMLIDNYRSTQAILDSSKVLIDQNVHRIINVMENMQKTLRAQNEELAASIILPRILAFPNRAQEETHIVWQLEQLREKGVPLQEVAIIYAKHKQAQQLIELMERKGIPYNTRRQLNTLDQPLIRQLRTLLWYIQAELQRPYSGEARLFQILHYQFLQIHPNSAARISLALANENNAQRRYWRDALQDEAFLTALDLQDTEQLLHLGRQLSQWIQDAVNLPVLPFLERIVNRSGLLNHVMDSPERLWSLQLIESFFDFVKKETNRRPRLKLNRLIEMLENLDANRLQIPVQKTVLATEGVNLMTAHSSKGLEFRYVFIMDCVTDNWDPVKNRNSYRFSFPDTITFSEESDAMEARRRLFYVAMTRAAEFLQLSFSEEDTKGKPMQHVQFIDEIMANTELQIERPQLDDQLLIEAQWLRLRETESLRLPSSDKAAIAKQLEGFAMSVSSLSSFLRCPLSFYYEYVLRVPTMTSESAAFGNAMHNSLRRLFEKMRLSTPKSFLSATEFQQLFLEELNKVRPYLSDNTFRQRATVGQEHAAQYYQQFISSWPHKVQVEYNIRNAELDGVPLKGVIDRIDLLDNQQVHIVDYKTGSTSRERLRPPTEREPYGGTYWRQLMFYKILYEQHQHERKVASGAVSYLEPDTKGHFEYTQLSYEPGHLDFMRELIRTSYARIQAHDFYEGCGEPSCAWCSFVRDTRPMASYVDEEREMLDD